MRFHRILLIVAQIVGGAALIYAVAATEIAAAAEAVHAPTQAVDPLRPIEIHLPDMMRLSRQKGTVIVDARSPEVYRRGHVAGAVNLPLDIALAGPEAIDRLPAGPNLVVYCDSSGCLNSSRVARLIKERTSRNVMVYSGGWGEWSSLDLPKDE